MIKCYNAAIRLTALSHSEQLENMEDNMANSASHMASYTWPIIYSAVFKLKLSVLDAFRKIAKSDR